MIKRSERWALTGILTLALLTRIFYLGAAVDRLDGLVIADARTYDLLAVNLAEDGYYGIDAPWSYRPPLYPFFLSWIYRCGGHSYLAARLAQAALAALSTLLVFLIARDLSGFGAGLLAGLLTALDFSLIHLSGLLLSENLYIPLSLLLIRLLQKGFREPRFATFIGAGVAGGLAALCRPTVLPFLGLVVLVPVLQRTLKGAATTGVLEHTGMGAGLAGVGVMLAAAVLTIGPWTIRNWRVHRAFVPVSTNGGTMLWMGLHPGAPGDYHYPEEDNPLWGIDDEVERNRVGMQESLRFIRDYPGEFFRLAVVKMRIFWRGYLFTWSGRQWALYGVLGLGGLILSLWQWPRWLLLYLYLAAFTGLHLFVHSSERYRLPLHPLIAIWAALFLARIWSAGRQWRASR